MSVDVSEQAGPAENLPAGDADPLATSRRPLVAGALGALWALLVGLALMTFLVMLSWAVSPSPAGDSAAAWRAVGSAWLGAHLVPLEVGGEWITLLPMGGLLLGLLLSRRSGGWAGRMLPEPAGTEVAWCLLGAAVAYGAGGAGVAWLTAGGAASADPRWAGPITAGVAAAGTLWGLAREAGLVARWRARLPQAAWRTLIAGLAAVVGLFGAGALLVAVGLLRSFPGVVGALADLDPGVVGAAGLTLLGALSLPNLAVWGMSVLVGPGFQLGRIGGLSAFGGEVGSLPALPALAAIPASVPSWAPVLLALPVALGVLAGRVRWGRDLPTLAGTAASGLGLAGVVAAGVAGLVALSSGSLGSDRLAQVGPALVPVTASATGLVVLGFTLEAAFQSLRLTWELHRAGRAAVAESGVVAGAARAGVADVPGTPRAHEVASSALEGVPAAEADDALGDARTPRSAVPARVATAAAGRVAGASRAVSSRVTAAGASAVGVVTGVGGAAIEIAASGTAAARRTGGADGEGDREIDLRDDPAEAEADAGVEADDEGDREIDLRDDPAEAEADAGVEAGAETMADDESVLGESDEHDRGSDVDEVAASVDVDEAADGPVVGDAQVVIAPPGTDEDTDEIPIIRRPREGDRTR